jgi:diadenosine tetraphosphate (Ap4A) HIT family hydrolase
MGQCPFCAKIDTGKFRWANGLAVAFADLYPVGPGHTLIVSRRHQSNLFDLDPAARAAVWALVDEVHRDLIEEFDADGFNIGLNEGNAAGRTVEHAHVHVIPRFAGDVPDPRGGVRWVLPSHADYWSR